LRRVDPIATLYTIVRRDFIEKRLNLGVVKDFHQQQFIVIY